MNTRDILAAALILSLHLGTPAAAGSTTTAREPVGGPGSCSSEGFNDPGLLADGVTPASATYLFALDPVAETLTLTVQNTSPVSVGIPNPVLKQIFFNAPLQITGMSLVSQTGSGGADPDFAFTFDADTTTNPNPNGAGPFGAFSAELNTDGGVAGGIANPLADTIGGPPGAAALGPVAFVFDLTGDLTGLTAEDFSLTSSVIPPGNKPSNAAGHFQAGGEASASAFISNGVEDCLLILSTEPGSGTLVGPPPYLHSYPIQLGGTPQVFAATFKVPLQLPVPGFGRRPTLGATAMLPGGATAGLPVLGVPLLRGRVQMVMWNPQLFPANPEQYSHGVEFTVWSSGVLTSSEFGASNGMGLTVTLQYTAEGRPYVRFPFSMNEF